MVVSQAATPAVFRDELVSHLKREVTRYRARADAAKAAKLKASYTDYADALNEQIAFIEGIAFNTVS